MSFPLSLFLVYEIEILQLAMGPGYASGQVNRVGYWQIPKAVVLSVSLSERFWSVCYDEFFSKSSFSIRYDMGHNVIW